MNAPKFATPKSLSSGFPEGLIKSVVLPCKHFHSTDLENDCGLSLALPNN